MKPDAHRIRGAALLLLSAVLPAFAQAPPAPPPGGADSLRSIERPRERQRRAPEIPAPAPAAPLGLPPIPADPGRARAPATDAAYVQAYRLSGNTVFTADELAEITRPFEGRRVTSEELEDLRQRLTVFYVERGYVNSGALLPDQRIADGVVEIVIVEGELATIEVQGTARLQDGYLRNRLARGAGSPLNVGSLQEQIQLLLQSPFVERINADLVPGDKRGEANLRARVVEKSPYQLTFSFDNHLSPSQGDLQAIASGTVYNLTGWGDTLNTELALAEGLKAASIDYAHPLNARDTTLSVRFDGARSEVVEEPFNVLDIESDFWSLGLALSHPIYRRPAGELSVTALLERRHSQTFLLGQGFAFSPGVESDGVSNVSVLRVSADWLQRTRSQVVAARSTLSVGLDTLDATSNAVGPSGEFAALLLQFQWARRLGESNVEALFRADAQLTNHQLLPLEQFAVGGADSVRGYRENQLVRDWGYAASLELRIPLPVFVGPDERPSLRLAPFVDLGGGWNNDRATPEPRNIAAVGAGLLWDPTEKVHAELYWGLPLLNADNPDGSLQDAGLHFRLSANLFD